MIIRPKHTVIIIQHGTYFFKKNTGVFSPFTM